MFLNLKNPFALPAQSACTGSISVFFLTPGSAWTRRIRIQEVKNADPCESGFDRYNLVPRWYPDPKVI